MATLEPIVGGVDSGSDAINKLDRNIKKLNLEIQDIDITDKIKNNLTETVPGNALDAVQGKLLAEQISILSTGIGLFTSLKTTAKKIVDAINEIWDKLTKTDISCTLLNGYSGTANGFKSVNNVELSLNLNTVGATLGAYTPIATLPINCRPTVQKRFIIENNNGAYRAIIVQTNGNVIVGDTAFVSGWAIATLNWIV